MPIYEYRCPKCQHEFDMLRPFSQSDEATECPKCRQSAERKISATSHALKDPNEFPSSWRKT